MLEGLGAGSIPVRPELRGGCCAIKRAELRSEKWWRSRPMKPGAPEDVLPAYFEKSLCKHSHRV